MPRRRRAREDAAVHARRRDRAARAASRPSARPRPTSASWPIDPENLTAAQALVPIYRAGEKWARLLATYEIILGATAVSSGDADADHRAASRDRRAVRGEAGLEVAGVRLGGQGLSAPPGRRGAAEGAGAARRRGRGVGRAGRDLSGRGRQGDRRGAQGRALPPAGAHRADAALQARRGAPVVRGGACSARPTTPRRSATSSRSSRRRGTTRSCSRSIASARRARPIRSGASRCSSRSPGSRRSSSAIPLAASATYRKILETDGRRRRRRGRCARSRSCTRRAATPAAGRRARAAAGARRQGDERHAARAVAAARRDLRAQPAISRTRRCRTIARRSRCRRRTSRRWRRSSAGSAGGQGRRSGRGGAAAGAGLRAAAAIGEADAARKLVDALEIAARGREGAGGGAGAAAAPHGSVGDAARRRGARLRLRRPRLSARARRRREPARDGDARRSARQARRLGGAAVRGGGGGRPGAASQSWRAISAGISGSSSTRASACPTTPSRPTSACSTRDPANEDAQIALVQLYSVNERWQDLRSLLEGKKARALDPEARLSLLYQICDLDEGVLDDRHGGDARLPRGARDRSRRRSAPSARSSGSTPPTRAGRRSTSCSARRIPFAAPGGEAIGHARVARAPDLPARRAARQPARRAPRRRRSVRGGARRSSRATRARARGSRR